jgi:hypothetical protein
MPVVRFNANRAQALSRIPVRFYAGTYATWTEIHGVTMSPGSWALSAIKRDANDRHLSLLPIERY